MHAIASTASYLLPTQSTRSTSSTITDHAPAASTRKGLSRWQMAAPRRHRPPHTVPLTVSRRHHIENTGLHSGLEQLLEHSRPRGVDTLHFPHLHSRRVYTEHACSGWTGFSIASQPYVATSHKPLKIGCQYRQSRVRRLVPSRVVTKVLCRGLASGLIRLIRLIDTRLG